MRWAGSRVAVPVAACVLAGSLLGGCQGKPGDEPTSAPTTTAATSPPSPTPTGPTEPVLPESAKADTAEGAARFVEYYIALMNYSAATGDTATMRARSKGCAGCESYRHLYEKTYGAGGFFEDPRWMPLNTVAQRVKEQVIVLLDVSTSPFEFRLKSGDKLRQAKAANYKLRLTVARPGAGWNVRRLDKQAALE